ncbi:SLAM family member 5 isoform X1 [Psammomys obesus]|uniref:SLAM family member 5 isoform X1 n=1 Tax=Psammomys obesus TaxID=48139 RepID=UPI002452C771|nr:SLAM family member 5 isoform X1 [Psammomys obesus]
MDQHHLWICFLCLQTWSEAAERGTDSSVVTGILGESVTFPIVIQEPQKINSIAWTCESSVAFVKPGVQGAPPDVTVTHLSYKGRIKVIDQNYSLVIGDLRMEDAGIYKADINEENSDHTITKRYHLQIYRRLEKPTITQSSITSVNNTCNVTLTCSVGKEEKNVTYSWSPSGEKSNVLQIFQSPEDKKLIYTCMAKNPVSNNSDSITVQKLCADTPSFQSHHAGSSSGLAALSLPILIPILVLLFYLYKRKQGTLGEETVYSPVSKNASHRESRIYDEIPESKVLSCKEEPINTIYSSVQASEKMRKSNMKDDRPPKTLDNEIV